ncbi:glycosyltransferase [Aggregatimonas sangjinii]|uniref:Glycosyltransferase n=1 Tax=Aggregatimonas sangjinii TaxID=2583587 RepID=A0A5B7SQZ0_9FLAO|nr:CDP-glycerol glycerophosphotransferase family protein [Aggregatimonas sangjinii]QCW99349.1 glycosyltransferase [Aggregatimonas sangjinii]
MKFILFCQNAYAFGILAPIREVLVAQEDDFIWYLSKKLLHKFPFKNEPHTTSILDLQYYKSDVIFVPGNEVPYYLRGLKTQIFHGLAGEKKGHFRIRHYFDLYLTQGPYFTNRFNELKAKHKDFEVIETGWPKLDVYGTDRNRYDAEKEQLLKEHHTDKIILYAPTFSPSLTSAEDLLGEIEKLAVQTGYLIFIKFHDLMDVQFIEAYKTLSEKYGNIIFKEEKNIIKYLLQADLLISDTSSVIYEFLLLDKPAISYKTIAEHIRWDNFKEKSGLIDHVLTNLNSQVFSKQRKELNAMLHPYSDGKSSERMVAAAKEYIKKNGVPEKRNLPLFRKLKIDAIFGKPIKNLWDGKVRNKISALLITFNEIANIDEVLENIQFADEIIVVDSYSTDGTVERIKTNSRVQLFQRPFINYTNQKSFAMKQASNDWILFLDADERLTDALKNEVLLTVNSENAAEAYMFYRTFMFQKKILRFSGWQSDKNFRLFRKSKASFTKDRIVHETLNVDGKTDVLNHKLIHYSYTNYEDYKGKMIKYGQMKAQEEFEKNYKPNLYHFTLRPAYRFFNHYFLRLGFLDGKKGIIISYLNALGVYSRYKELKRLRQINTN